MATQGMQTWSRRPAEVQAEHQNEEARWAGLSTSGTAGLLWLSHTAVSLTSMIWMKRPCCCQRSEENDPTASSCREGSNNFCLPFTITIILWMQHQILDGCKRFPEGENSAFWKGRHWHVHAMVATPISTPSTCGLAKETAAFLVFWILCINQCFSTVSCQVSWHYA